MCVCESIFTNAMWWWYQLSHPNNLQASIFTFLRPFTCLCIWTSPIITTSMTHMFSYTIFGPFSFCWLWGPPCTWWCSCRPQSHLTTPLSSSLPTSVRDAQVPLWALMMVTSLSSSSHFTYNCCSNGDLLRSLSFSLLACYSHHCVLSSFEALWVALIHSLQHFSLC